MLYIPRSGKDGWCPPSFYCHSIGKEVLTCFSPLTIVIPSLLTDQFCKGQLAELSAILDSFYTSVTNTTSDYIGVEVKSGASREP